MDSASSSTSAPGDGVATAAMAAAKVQPHMSLGLRVLSSSLQVEQPINFDDLPATTTVGQLKEKIQQVLPHHQPREHQRLIYRGRLLADDNETLVNVVGEETVRSADKQTFHLALRDGVPSGSGGQRTRRLDAVPAPVVSPSATTPAPVLASMTTTTTTRTPDGTTHHVQEGVTADGTPWRLVVGTTTTTTTTSVNGQPADAGQGPTEAPLQDGGDILVQGPAPQQDFHMHAPFYNQHLGPTPGRTAMRPPTPDPRPLDALGLAQVLAQQTLFDGGGVGGRFGEDVYSTPQLQPNDMEMYMLWSPTGPVAIVANPRVGAVHYTINHQQQQYPPSPGLAGRTQLDAVFNSGPFNHHPFAAPMPTDAFAPFPQDGASIVHQHQLAQQRHLVALAQQRQAQLQAQQQMHQRQYHYQRQHQHQHQHVPDQPLENAPIQVHYRDVVDQQPTPHTNAFFPALPRPGGGGGDGVEADEVSEAIAEFATLRSVRELRSHVAMQQFIAGGPPPLAVYGGSTWPVSDDDIFAAVPRDDAEEASLTVSLDRQEPVVRRLARRLRDLQAEVVGSTAVVDNNNNNPSSSRRLESRAAALAPELRHFLRRLRLAVAGVEGVARVYAVRLPDDTPELGRARQVADAWGLVAAATPEVSAEEGAETMAVARLQTAVHSLQQGLAAVEALMARARDVAQRLEAAVVAPPPPPPLENVAATTTSTGLRVGAGRNHHRQAPVVRSSSVPVDADGSAASSRATRATGADIHNLGGNSDGGGNATTTTAVSGAVRRPAAGSRRSSRRVEIQDGPAGGRGAQDAAAVPQGEGGVAIPVHRHHHHHAHAHAHAQPARMHRPARQWNRAAALLDQQPQGQPQGQGQQPQQGIDGQMLQHQHQQPLGLGALALALLQLARPLLPHLWLLVRLAGFVWWFTTPHASWGRWLAVVAMAAGVFVANTGLLNGLADAAWGPFRRHLENLILPDGGLRAGGVAAENANNHVHVGERAPDVIINNPNNPNPPPPRHQQQPPQPPTPTTTTTTQQPAAQNNNHAGHENLSPLLAAVRQVERAVLLFLASLAPGVAERHINSINAERARRLRAAHDAAAQAQAARDAEAGEPGDEATAAAAAGEEEEAPPLHPHDDGADHRNQRPPPPDPQPLVL